MQIKFAYLQLLFLNHLKKLNLDFRLLYHYLIIMLSNRCLRSLYLQRMRFEHSLSYHLVYHLKLRLSHMPSIKIQDKTYN
jgi:hypothetical protein